VSAAHLNKEKHSANTPTNNTAITSGTAIRFTVSPSPFYFRHMNYIVPASLTNLRFISYRLFLFGNSKSSSP
jgi:hypothetical protein